LDAGDEIFLNYGHCNSDDESLPNWAVNIPKTDDFLVAATITSGIWKELSTRTLNVTVDESTSLEYGTSSTSYQKT
jgi:hypothetical protein